MTEYRGFDEPQGPGWWKASDGKWYPKEAASPPPEPPTRPAVATVTEERPQRRGSPALMIVSVAVLVVGLALTVVGLIFGGTDEEARADLNAQIDAAETELASVETELADAEVWADTTVAQSEVFVADAEEIVSVAQEACDCGSTVTTAWDDLVVAASAFASDPSQANMDAVNAVISSTINPEETRLFGLLDQVRALMVERAPIPGSIDGG
jgi:hypothetical protein